MTTIAQLIAQIERRQPVRNRADLSAAQLNVMLTGIGSLTSAQSTQLSFLSDARYLNSLAQTRAGAVLVTEQYAEQVPQDSVVLVVADPYLAYASCSHQFVQDSTSSEIHPSAVIDDSAVLGDDISIGPFCVIGKQVTIGKGSRIAAQVSIADHATLGDTCIIEPQVMIGRDCHLGHHVRVHAGARIGAEGFGFAPTKDPSRQGWERIVQLGRVIIGDHVRIGSNSCIDRGAVDDTQIGDHVIIDNLVQIAHNVCIGAGSAIAAQTGIAGSTTIGKRCIIGGAVGITGHINITDDVTISAMSMVTKSIRVSGSYSSGTVAMPTAKWRKAAVRFRKLGYE